MFTTPVVEEYLATFTIKNENYHKKTLTHGIISTKEDASTSYEQV